MLTIVHFSLRDEVAAHGMERANIGKAGKRGLRLGRKCHYFKVMSTVGRGFVRGGFLILALVAGFGGLHLGASLCPMAGQRVAVDRWLPVVYGMPSGEGWEAARDGRIVLGGCVSGPVRYLCPHCRWPIAFREPDRL